MDELRPVRKKNRNCKQCFALSQEEKRILEQTADMMNMSQTELIVYAVKKVRQIELQKREYAKRATKG